MYKNQLQELAQRSCFNLPSYTCIREGLDHTPRFKAIANFNGETFESPHYFPMLHQAEHAATEVALNSRPANAAFVRLEGYATEHRRYALEQRCTSKGRGSVYYPVFGICCHFCRQKKLCGEEDCKRCGDLDMDQPCLGKTDCSVCHSSNGVLCRACLKVRYGEEMEEVRENKEWICPHCI